MDTTAKGAKKNTSQYLVHKQNIITPFYFALHKKCIFIRCTINCICQWMITRSDMQKKETD